MNAHTLTLFKVFKKQFSEEDASLLVETIEEITKNKITEQEGYTTKSIQHQVEQKIDLYVERKIEKEHKYLATKEDIIAVKEDITVVREELQAFKEDVHRKIVAVEEKIVILQGEIIKQYRSFLTVNITMLAIVVSMFIYLIAKIS